MQNHHHKTSPFECGFRAKSDEMRGIGDTAPGWGIRWARSDGCIL